MNEGIEGRRGGEKNPRTQYQKQNKKNNYLLGLDKWSHWLDLGFFFFSFLLFLLEYCSVIWFLRMGQDKIAK